MAKCLLAFLVYFLRKMTATYIIELTDQRFRSWFVVHCPFGSQTLPKLTHWGPRRNEQHFADHIFKRIFFNENVWISIKISLKFVPKGPINHIPSLAQIMAWPRSGDKPLSGPMMVSLPTHICVTRPQWVNTDPSLALWVLVMPLLNTRNP